jgi:hypothetical protein
MTLVTYIKDVLERAATSFVQAVLALVVVAQFSDFNTSFVRQLATAGLVAAASTLKTMSIPKAGFGLTPAIDVLARATLTAVFAAAATITASAGFDLFSVTAWQAVGVAAVAAAASVVKSWIAERFVQNTLTPASLAKAA